MAPGVGSRRILVADDQPDVLEALRLLLKGEGFDLETASSPAGVARAVEGGDFDLVLMDLNLPEVDGWEATRRIRATPEGGRLPIIALTAHALAGDEEKALAAGCNDYHTKPVDFARLMSQIEAILDKKPAL